MEKVIDLNKKYMFYFECKEGNFFIETTDNKAINMFYKQRYKIEKLDKLTFDENKINFNKKGIIKNGVSE